MKNLLKKKGLLLFVAILLISSSLSGCGLLENIANQGEEKLKGTSFTTSIYNHFGEKTLTLSGEKISLDVLDATSSFFSSSTDATYASSVLDITIDGKQAILVGDTMIFAEKGLDMITDFDVPEEIISSDGGTGLQFVDRYINNFKNNMGKAKVIIISSQMGIPIGVYQGSEVYVEVPSDLPKTTRISIDGKALYIHRANYQIVDTELIK